MGGEGGEKQALSVNEIKKARKILCVLVCASISK